MLNQTRTIPRLGMSLSDLLVYTQLIQAQSTLLHRHNFIEFFCVLNGSCTHVVNGEEKNLLPGDAFLLFPEDCHIMTNPSENFTHRDVLIDLKYFEKVCSVYSGDFYGFFHANAAKQTYMTTEQIHDIENCVVTLFEPHSDKREINACSIVTRVINLFLQDMTNTTKNIPRWLIQLSQYLSNPQSFHEDLQVIVRRFSYSQGYTCRMFKKYFGITMGDYFNKQKINYAHTLLQTTDLPIEQISASVGFDSLSHFYRTFKSAFSLPPASYRKEKATEISLEASLWNGNDSSNS